MIDGAARCHWLQVYTAINSEIRRLRPDFDKIVESTAVSSKIFVHIRAKTDLYKFIYFFFTYPPFKEKKNQLPMTWLTDLVSRKESAWGSFGGGDVVYRATNHIQAWL